MSLAITLDIDWAPDFMIDWVAERLLARSVPATWFVTHPSAAVERLKQRPDLFELGIHPNFSRGSSHGENPSNVLRHCMSILPTARIMRTHQLVQSTPILTEIMQSTPIAVDCSIYQPHATAAEATALWYDGRALVRIPYVWEDDFEVERPRQIWRLREMAQPPLCVFGFHPIHVFLNSRSLDAYRQLKREFPNLADATPIRSAELVNDGIGPLTMFDDVMESISVAPRIRLLDVRDKVLAQ